MKHPDFLQIGMGYFLPEVVHDCIDAKMRPEDRLCAADEWKDILLSWMHECTGDEVDRYLRLHDILQRCIHA